MAEVFRVNSRERPVSVPWLSVAAAFLCLASNIHCSTDHEQLAERPGSGGSGGTGSGGQGGNAAATTLTSSVGSTSTSTSSGGTVHYPPDGQDVLTLVHGQIDAERIAFCVAKGAGDAEANFDAPPIPDGGLGYGEAFTLGESEAVDFEAEDLKLVVLTGEFDADAECRETLAQAYWPARLHEPDSDETGAAGAAGAGGMGAGGASPVERPPLRALELPTIPANSLVLGRHYVMVLTGCMGGPGVVDDGLHCGRTHSPQTPSLRPVLVPVTREVESGRLSLQFMHASAATPSVDIQSLPGTDGVGVQLYLATGLSFGRIIPMELQRTYSFEELGLDGGAELVVNGVNMQQFRAPWSEIAGRTEIAADNSYLAILLGPTLGTNSADGFNETRVTLLATGIGRAE